MSSKNENEDFLEVDQKIPGQNYVCLSFISPENIVKKKELYNVKYFLTKILNDGPALKKLSENEITYDLVNDMFENFKIIYEKEANTNFDEENNFTTSVRGVKVRGIYDSIREAQIRAKILQRRDKNFNVFVGQVGYWLPWDPDPYNVDKQEYLESELNNLMSKYNENVREKEELFENNKSEKIKSAREKSNVINKNHKEAREKIEELRKILNAKENIMKSSKSSKSNINSTELNDTSDKLVDTTVQEGDDETKEQDDAQDDAQDDVQEDAQDDAQDDVQEDYDPLGTKSGASDPWMAQKLESNSKTNTKTNTDDNSYSENQPTIISNETIKLESIVKNIF